MIFLTRTIYNAFQPNSKTRVRAAREWKRRNKIYSKYLDLIIPFLPKEVARLADAGLHDARIISFKAYKNSLRLKLDVSKALTPLRGRRQSLLLNFTGVEHIHPPQIPDGQFWLYEEAHLASNGFSLHVFLDKLDLEIRAKNLVIKEG